MKKMSTSAMRNANGGRIFFASAKCPFCGKKYTGLFVAAALYDAHVRTCSKRRNGW